MIANWFTSDCTDSLHCLATVSDKIQISLYIFEVYDLGVLSDTPCISSDKATPFLSIDRKVSFLLGIVIILRWLQ